MWRCGNFTFCWWMVSTNAFHESRYGGKSHFRSLGLVFVWHKCPSPRSDSLPFKYLSILGFKENCSYIEKIQRLNGDLCNLDILDCCVKPTWRQVLLANFGDEIDLIGAEDKST